MQAIWGVSGRGVSLWPMWAVLYVIIGVRSGTGPVTRIDGLKVVRIEGSFLTQPGLRMTIAVLAAIQSTILPLIERL
jgi:hypothetical protein